MSTPASSPTLAKQIEFCVADATDRKSILELKRNRAFTKAVSNMAIMDITDIEPLLMAVYELLQESGIFVFATQHPCLDVYKRQGQSSTEAERKRAARIQNKALSAPRTNGGHLSDIRPPEIEIELEKVIEIKREIEKGRSARAYGRYQNEMCIRDRLKWT